MFYVVIVFVRFHSLLIKMGGSRKKRFISSLDFLCITKVYIYMQYIMKYFIKNVYQRVVKCSNHVLLVILHCLTNIKLFLCDAYYTEGSMGYNNSQPIVGNLR